MYKKLCVVGLLVLLVSLSETSVVAMVFNEKTTTQNHNETFDSKDFKKC